jgi:hypothetical protein
MTGGEVGAGQTGMEVGGLSKRGRADDQGLGLERDSDETYVHRPEGGNVVQALVSQLPTIGIRSFWQWQDND